MSAFPTQHMRQKIMRGALFFASVLGLVLPSSASEEEYNNCIGNRFGTLADLSEVANVDYSGGMFTCSPGNSVVDEDLVRGTTLFCGFGADGDSKCCGTQHISREVADNTVTTEFLVVYNNLNFKGDADALDSDTYDDSKCAESVEPGSSSGCGETCAIGWIIKTPAGAEGTSAEYEETDLKWCEGKIKVTTESSGAISNFKCTEVAAEDLAFGAGGGAGESSQCFPSAATVQLESGAVKSMSDLVVGDVVRVSATEYSPVFMFTHKLAHVANSFVEIGTASGHRLSATPGHFVYVNGDLAPASTIRVGDHLTVDTGDDSEVIEVSRAKHVGLYNPQTIHGDLVVNGVVSSTYTAAVKPVVAHGVLAPLRGVYRLFNAFVRARDQTTVMLSEVGNF